MTTQKTMRYYYKAEAQRAVLVYPYEPEIPDTSEITFLGSTDNPIVKMAVSSFLSKDASGYRIIDYTDPKTKEQIDAIQKEENI